MDMTAISESDAMALQVTDVTKHYDSGFTLDDVTFDLPKGYIMGLIGPNGAGKSTLIKLILKLNVLSRHCIHHGTVDAITSIWILLALVAHRTARNISRIFPAACR